MKSLLKVILFSAEKPNRILSGVSSGMLANYDPKDRTLHLLGLYEREIYASFIASAKKADTLIDIGANDGYYGLAFAKYKGKEIIVCEPGEEKESLRKNLNINGLVENKDFLLIDKFVSGVTNEREISINDLLIDKKRVFILLDVDGGEQQIVENFRFDSDVKIDWLIETHSLELESNISKVFIAHGYKVRIIRNAWWRKFIPEKRPLAHNRWMHAIKDL